MAVKSIGQIATRANVALTILLAAQNVTVEHTLELVGARGFEPPTSWSQTTRSTKLSYAPKLWIDLSRIASACIRKGAPDLSRRRPLYQAKLRPDIADDLSRLSAACMQKN
jgi:hypothetical protein